MKSLGMVRLIDELGRIVIPMELRKTMNIGKRAPLEIYTEGSNIVIQKYETQCILCGSGDDIIEFKEKPLCKKCLNAIKKGIK